MNDALTVHRLQFAFTVTYHYLFPQLTMGLALLIVVMKFLGLRSGDGRWNEAARFAGKIFALNFLAGVITGIPMEFQFGTNWARFSKYAGGVIGQTLAMEGIFSFFLESSFLGLFLFGEKRLGPRRHFFSALLVWFGSWLSGYLIVMTDAWMQHPVGYEIGPEGSVRLTGFLDLLFNPWGLWQYLHTMAGSVVTASFAVASIGAYYLLSGRDRLFGERFLRIGVIAGLLATAGTIFPTGDQQGKNVAYYQPATLAAMEGLFQTKQGAELILIGQPDMERQKMDNPIHIPNMLSFLTYNHWKAEVKGLDAFPRDDWPDNIPLLYYSYHIMVGLGTIFIAVTAICFWKLRKDSLFASRPLLWILAASLPFPFISNTAGWITAEVGRQPWVIYGLMRTSDGASMNVSAGNALFTLIGFMGMYTVVGILFLFLVGREIEHGPEAEVTEPIDPRTARAAARS